MCVCVCVGGVFLKLLQRENVVLRAKYDFIGKCCGKCMTMYIHCVSWGKQAVSE